MRNTYLIASAILVVCPCNYGENNVINAQEKPEDNIVFTILCNNASMSDSIFADHGFSCLIEAGGHTCLFDAGNNADKFMTNVNKAGVDCSGIDHIFISHVHNDHMGGLFDILDKCNKPTLCMPVSYPRQEGESFGEQADKDYAAMLDQLRPFVSEIVQSQDLVNLGDDFYTAGVIDKQSHEQALIIPTSRGMTIITGCAHPGILEIVRHAKEMMKQDVYLVMGGFHLAPTDSTQVETIARELRQLTKYIGPCHCTGENAQSIFRDIFGEDYIDIQAGMKLKSDESKLK